MALPYGLVILGPVKWQIAAVFLAAVGFLVAPVATGNDYLIDDAGAVASSSHDSAHGNLPSIIAANGQPRFGMSSPICQRPRGSTRPHERDRRQELGRHAAPS